MRPVGHTIDSESSSPIRKGEKRCWADNDVSTHLGMDVAEQPDQSGPLRTFLNGPSGLDHFVERAASSLGIDIMCLGVIVQESDRLAPGNGLDSGNEL